VPVVFIRILLVCKRKPTLVRFCLGQPARRDCPPTTFFLLRLFLYKGNRLIRLYILKALARLVGPRNRDVNGIGLPHPKGQDRLHRRLESTGRHHLLEKRPSLRRRQRHL